MPGLGVRREMLVWVWLFGLVINVTCLIGEVRTRAFEADVSAEMLCVG